MVLLMAAKGKDNAAVSCQRMPQGRLQLRRRLHLGKVVPPKLIGETFFMGRNTLVVGDGDFSFSLGMAGWLSGSNGHGTSIAASVLTTQVEAYKRYTSSVLEQTLHVMKAQGVECHFGVDACDLITTAPHHCDMIDAVIWTFPFPENDHFGADQTSKTSLLDGFFQSVASWPSFAATGIVILGLKPARGKRGKQYIFNDEDFQLNRWGVEQIAGRHGFAKVSTLGPGLPFWRPTKVSGAPINTKDELADGMIPVKFYAFELRSGY